MSKRQHTPASAAVGIEHAIRMLEGRWKLVILFHLFGGRTLRFSDLERAIPAISQKMLIQQLRQLERDGIVVRIVSIICSGPLPSKPSFSPLWSFSFLYIRKRGSVYGPPHALV